MEDEFDTTSSSGTASTPPPARTRFSTVLRNRVTPLLPPPVVTAMDQLDQRLEPTLGPDGTIRTFILAVLLWRVFSLVFGNSTKSGRGKEASAIQEDVQEDDIVDADNVQYDGTVLLCGPPQSGKTTMFYSLVYPKPPSASTESSTVSSTSSLLFPTVSSIKPNTGYATIHPTREEKNNTSIWRFLDIPGHWGAEKMVSTVLSDTSTTASTLPLRIIVVLDATQPIAKSADYLYHIIMQQQQQQQQRNNTPFPYILVACHKYQSSSSKVKNVRRIKLQLRNELERLSRLESIHHNNDNNNTDSSNATVDWEHVLQHQVGFVPTDCQSTTTTGNDTPDTSSSSTTTTTQIPNMLGLEELKHYIDSGNLPSMSIST